jgi:paraquat-inducible protein B
MSERSRSRAIGLFVISALVLLVLGLLTFGSREFYSPKSSFVVVFTDSVRGLAAGATVAYQGVSIGEVREIAIQRDSASGALLIPVMIELRSQAVRSLVGDDDSEQRFVDGFRAKLAQQSFVTGRLMIELEYAPSLQGRTHVLDGNLPQIPTLPSALEVANAAFEDTMNKVQRMPLDDIARRLDQLLLNANALLGSPELANTIRRSDNISADSELLLHNLSQQLPLVLSDLRKAAQDVSRAAGRFETLSDKGETTLNATAALADKAQGSLALLDETLAQSSKTLASFEQLARDSQQLPPELQRSLRELETTLRSGRDLLDTLKRQPEAVIRGRN